MPISVCLEFGVTNQLMTEIVFILVPCSLCRARWIFIVGIQKNLRMAKFRFGSSIVRK